MYCEFCLSTGNYILRLEKVHIEFNIEQSRLDKSPFTMHMTL